MTDGPLTDPAAPAGDEETSPRRRMSRSTRSAIEWVAVIVGALVVALVVKVFLVQAFYIPSASMEPTLQIGDRVLVNKLDDGIGGLDRGDVIVFDRPGGAGADGISELIKRVIGLPGETIEGRNGVVLVDGQQLSERYLPSGTTTSDFPPQEVPIGEVWVMGDNRDQSDDSRRFGTIPEDDIVGRAFVIIWPPSEVGTL